MAMDQGFISQALVYMAAAVVVVPISRRLGLGSVLGFLVAGVAIGPFGLGLISDVQDVLHFAEFGVVMLLFLVGLELQPSRIWEMRRLLFGLGAAQVGITLAVTAIGALAVGLPWRTAVVVGMGVAMSSTAIALQTMQERHLLATRSGNAALNVALFQDLAVIPMMTGLALLSPDQSEGASVLQWGKIGLAFALIAGVILAGRFLLRPLLRYIAKTDLREIFIAFSLLLVFGTALAVQAVGLSMALGTFLAGVLLADSEYRHELELDIEPFKGLLLGLFFIAVGMSIDIPAVLKNPVLVFALAFGLVALKLAILFGLGRLFGLSKAEAIPFAIVLSAVGEFAFVLFRIAASEKVIDSNTLNLLNAIVAVSMLTTPFLMMGYQRLCLGDARSESTREADVVDEQHSIVVAGFGRVGQVVTRLLVAKGFQATVIDHDPNHIELLKKFGWKTYYGDATRLDMLQAAGVGKATLVILAFDDGDALVKTAELIRSHYPDVKILSRAHGRSDAFELVDLGVKPYRETFFTAIAMGTDALVALGFEPHAAHRAAQEFRQHDERMLVEHAPHRKDQAKLIALASQGREDLENLMRDERTPVSQGNNWKADALSEEVIKR